MTKFSAMALAVCAALTLAFATPAISAPPKKGKVHRVAVHISDNNKALMNLVLNNIQNMINHYKKAGQRVVVELVAYGPGLHIFREDTSPVKDRIATMALTNPNIKFSACTNTFNNMTRQTGKTIKLVSEAGRVPSGVIRLIELQQRGYAYIRP